MLAAALAVDGRDGELARSRLEDDTSLHAPHIVDLEVLSVFRRRAAAGQLDQRRAEFAIRDLEELPLTRYPHIPIAMRVWTLRNNLTPYDASYVALAEALDCALVTADRRLSTAAGIRCEVEVLTNP